MNRREFISLLGGAAAWPIAARAQQPDERARALLLRILQIQADNIAHSTAQFLTEVISEVGWTTQLPWSIGTMEQRRFDALRLLRQAPAVFDLRLLDDAGIEQEWVTRLTGDFIHRPVDRSQEPYFTEAVAHKAYFGPVYFRRLSEPYMTLSLAGTRRETGVAAAEIMLSAIQDMVSKTIIGKSGAVYVVDAEDRIFAHPNIDLVLRNDGIWKLPQVQAARAAGDGPVQPHTARDIYGQEVLSVSASVEPIKFPSLGAGFEAPPLGWRVFAELPLAETETVIP